MNIDKSEMKINNTVYLVEEVYSGNMKIEQMIEQLILHSTKL